MTKPNDKPILVDYSQIEARLLARIAEGVDIHALTASEMFDVPIKDVTADERRRAKAINYAGMYNIPSKEDGC